MYKPDSDSFLERTLHYVQEQLKKDSTDEVMIRIVEEWINPVRDYISERGSLVVRKGVEITPRGLSGLLFKSPRHYLIISRR